MAQLVHVIHRLAPAVVQPDAGIHEGWIHHDVHVLVDRGGRFRLEVHDEFTGGQVDRAGRPVEQAERVSGGGGSLLVASGRLSQVAMGVVPVVVVDGDAVDGALAGRLGLSRIATELLQARTLRRRLLAIITLGLTG